MASRRRWPLIALWLFGIGVALMPGWPDAATQTGYFIAGIACGLMLSPVPRCVSVREIADWLRHIDRYDDIPPERYGMPGCNPLWDAANAIEREFG